MIDDPGVKRALELTEEAVAAQTEEGQQACEVPLVEQLRSIPKDYRTVRAIQWSDDGRETGHQFIPVGFIMHRAADEIDRLNALPSERPAIPPLMCAVCGNKESFLFLDEHGNLPSSPTVNEESKDG